MAEQLQYLDSLNSKNTLFLIRQPSTGRILTGRRITPEQKDVYQKILRRKIPHVPYVRDILPEADGEFLVLQDYIQGITLEQLLQNRQVLTYQDAVWIGIQLCCALEELHASGIVHRDIKPANVMVTEQKEAFLIDFDISRTHKDGQRTDTAILGTRGYAAPEQFGFQQTDARTDIYAVGVLLNQMCTGEFPQTMHADPPLDKIIEKCVSIDPSGRYPNAASVRNALEAVYPEHRSNTMLTDTETHPVHTVKKQGIPGFRSGNPFYILLATLGYTFFTLLVLAIMTVATESVSNFIVSAVMILAPIVCYLFVFDVFSIRTRCVLVEKYRHTPRYRFYCGCLIAAGAVACFFILLVGINVVAPVFEK